MNASDLVVVEHVVVVPRWKRHFNPMPRPALAPLKMKLFAIDLRSPSRTVSLRGGFSNGFLRGSLQFVVRCCYWLLWAVFGVPVTTKFGSIDCGYQRNVWGGWNLRIACWCHPYIGDLAFLNFDLYGSGHSGCFSDEAKTPVCSKFRRTLKIPRWSEWIQSPHCPGVASARKNIQIFKIENFQIWKKCLICRKIRRADFLVVGLPLMLLVN